LVLRESNFGGSLRDGSFTVEYRAEPLVQVWRQCLQKLKKHCKLYTLEKYFVYHTRCQNDETVTSPAMLYRGGCLC